MNLKFKDLISIDICAKLSSVSFNSPKKNLDVYRLVSALNGPQSFFIKEHDKLLQKYGKPLKNGSYDLSDNINEYKSEMDKLLDLEIDGDIPCPSISADDFDSDKCVYSTDKNMWMNAKDINSVLSFIQKLKKIS